MGEGDDQGSAGAPSGEPDPEDGQAGRLRRWVRQEPPWVVREGLLALLIGIVLLIGQARLDDWRSTRETARAEQLAQSSEQLAEDLATQSERLENLRFIREYAGDPDLKRPFAGIDLRQQVLDGLMLRRADLSRALLVGASLQRADLEGATLTAVWLSASDLRGAKMAGAVLDCIEGRPPTRTTCAKLAGVDLSDADLTGASLVNADLEMARFRADTRLADADLTSADLSGARLLGVDLSSATLDGADLQGACWNAATLWPPGFEPRYEPAEGC